MENGNKKTVQVGRENQVTKTRRSIDFGNGGDCELQGKTEIRVRYLKYIVEDVTCYTYSMKQRDIKMKQLAHDNKELEHRIRAVRKLITIDNELYYRLVHSLTVIR